MRHTMKHLTALVCFAVMAMPALGAETLLVAIHHSSNQWDANSTANLSITTRVPSTGSSAKISGNYSPAAEGQTFEMPTDELTLMNAHFSQANAIAIIVELSPLSGARGNVDDIWSGSFAGEPSGSAANVTTFVPRLGPGLSGYHFTRLTQTIDWYHLEMNGRYLVASVGQTTRIYGDVAVPEPSTLLLAAVGLPLLLRRRRTLASCSRG